MNIDITFAYANNSPTSEPSVTDPETRVDSVAATETQVTWRPTGSTPSPSAAGLAITDIELFATSDRGKASRLTPDCFSGSGTANPDGSFTLTFDSSVAVASELELSYNLRFTDNLRRPAGTILTWDPTIKVKPRTATAPASETGADAG